jgi:hypothetical protein
MFDVRQWRGWRLWTATLCLTALAVALAGCGIKQKPEETKPARDEGDPKQRYDSSTDSPDRTDNPPSKDLVTKGLTGERLASAKTEAKNNLKLIALAFYAFHDANGRLPLGFYDKSGKKLGLSWRVAILPYIEQGNLYNQFKLDEPWDSANNKKLIAKMPALFTLKNAAPAQGYTHIRGFAGPQALFRPPAQGRPGQLAYGLPFLDITDGTANTILVAEVAEPVIWTKPDEPEYNPQKPVPALGGVFEDGFNAAMCDGTVHFFKLPQREELLRALITPQGGDVVDWPE